jgi:hypothetical protein
MTAAETDLTSSCAAPCTTMTPKCAAELTSLYTSVDAIGQVLQREKQRNLSRHPYQNNAPMDHAPGWNEQLASSSEAFIKVCHTTLILSYRNALDPVRQVDRHTAGPCGEDA